MKKKFKWTLNKVIITILIVAFFLFILFKTGLFDKIIDQFLTISPDVSEVVTGMGNGGGGRGW